MMMYEVRRYSRGNFIHPTLKKSGPCQGKTMLNGLTPARTHFFTGIYAKSFIKKIPVPVPLTIFKFRFFEKCVRS